MPDNPVAKVEARKMAEAEMECQGSGCQVGVESGGGKTQLYSQTKD